MQSALEQAGIFSANIGLFSKAEKEDSITYGEGGSGVIIRRKGSTYYALTAAHMVSVENAQLLVFTTNTQMKTDAIPSINYPVLSKETYDVYSPRRANIPLWGADSCKRNKAGHGHSAWRITAFLRASAQIRLNS